MNQNNIKIFILDDDRFYGSYICHSLKDSYGDVNYFQSWSECLEHMIDEPNILILDHKLEFCTGLSVINDLRKSEICKNTHILYLSAQEHVHITLEALKNGAVDYFEKGSKTVEALKNAIDRIEFLTNGFKSLLKIEEYRTMYG